MDTYGYISTATNSDHSHASLVELHCTRPDLLTFPPFIKIAQSICQRLLECPPTCEPKYLDRTNIDEDDIQKLRQECRRIALERGIPEEDLPLYISKLLQKRLGDLCLHEMSFEGRTIASHINEFSQQYGPIFVRRFFKITVKD